MASATSYTLLLTVDLPLCYETESMPVPDKEVTADHMAELDSKMQNNSTPRSRDPPRCEIFTVSTQNAQPTQKEFEVYDEYAAKADERLSEALDYLIIIYVLLCRRLEQTAPHLPFDFDKEVEKMLSMEIEEDARVTLLQSQVSSLMEQVQKLTQQAAQRIEAYIKLKQLRKCSSVADYCVELEELTRRVYPDASDKELSTIRAVELITQLTEWKEYTQLSSALEQSK
ncbi:hypothetical protein OSTOST_04678 [Ostertagia ostertagi]